MSTEPNHLGVLVGTVAGMILRMENEGAPLVMMDPFRNAVAWGCGQLGIPVASIYQLARKGEDMADREGLTGRTVATMTEEDAADLLERAGRLGLEDDDAGS